jgi:hypothetical protein
VVVADRWVDLTAAWPKLRSGTVADMVSDPVEARDDLVLVLARARALAESAGALVRDRRPTKWEPNIDPEDRQILLAALHGGTYLKKPPGSAEATRNWPISNDLQLRRSSSTMLYS